MPTALRPQDRARRWQPGDIDVLSSEPVCLLDVPAHKTGSAFTKPIDPVVGRAIEA